MSNVPAPNSLKSFFAHPSRWFWTLQIAGWLGYFLLYSLAAAGEGKGWDYVRFYFSAAVAGFAITSLLRWGYRSIWNWPTTRFVVSAAAMLVTAALLFAVLYSEMVFRYCDDCHRPQSILGYMWYVASALMLHLAWSGLYFGSKFNRQLREQKEAALKAQAMAHEAQLKMLRYQLNPHFLFNTLNAISTLILDGRRDTANGMVGSLSAFLRYSLDSDPVQRVTLAQEIDATNLYLGIEQLRFGERLRVRMSVTPEARTALVPSLILQPLIENAIKYAVSRREEGGTIEIEARCVSGYLNIVLRDDGPGCENFNERSSGHGVGLRNAQERLRVLYGDDQTFSIANRAPHGCEIHLRMPFEAMPDANAAPAELAA